MFSAMTTGPDTEKMEPKSDSRSWSLILRKSLCAFSSAPAYATFTRCEFVWTRPFLLFFIRTILNSNDDGEEREMK